VKIRTKIRVGDMPGGPREWFPGDPVVNPPIAPIAPR
jgi:hypothetical protein